MVGKWLIELIRIKGWLNSCLKGKFQKMIFDMCLVLDESIFSPEISDSQFEDKDWSDFKSLSL